MKKTVKNKSLFLLILISFIILIITFEISTQGKNQDAKFSRETPQSNTESKLKTFKSSNAMKFSINIPKNLEANENLGKVTISSVNGIIYIDRNGTNFDNLNDYLVDIGKNNAPKILEEEQKLINNYQGNIRLIKYGTGEIQKSIIIFSDGWIFNIYTNSETLYKDLDQIAQSFRYTP